MRRSDAAPERAPRRLYSPRFLSFFFVQALGAANDNAFKIALSLFLLAHLPDEAAQVRFASLAQFLFPLPFLLFSPLAGFLADRFGKGRMIFFTKLPEILAMGLSIAAFGAGSPIFLMVVLFLMALQSAFFSPVKYGLLPESLESRDLSMGNGILQMTTNLAILVGTALGVAIYDRFSARPEWTGVMLLGVALVGTLAALYVPRTPAGSPLARFEANPWRSFRDNWDEARRDPALFQALLGIAYFWWLGSLFLTIVPIFARNALGTSVQGSGLMLMILSVGIAVGSMMAGHLSRGRVELGLVPLGSLGLAAFTLDLATVGETAARWAGFPVRAGVDLLLLGAAAGLFIVPLNALLQQRSPQGGKGRMIAFSNLLTFSAVLAAAAIPWLTSYFLGWSSRQIVLASGLATAAVTLYIVSLMPQFLVRLVLWLLTNTIYRIRAVGDENLPRGGGLLVANHVSWVDALLIGAACDRNIRFMMYRPFYEVRPLNWFFRRMRVIPVSGRDEPARKEQSLEHARREISRGHLVCIFAEGSITRTGNLLRFRPGLERIAAAAAAPIVPVLLDGVWGSIFSYRGGRLLFRRPRRLLAPVRIVFGSPMPSTAKAYSVRQRIQELSVEAFALRKNEQRPLPIQFLRRAKRRWRRSFAVEHGGRGARFGQALVRVLVLRRALFRDDAAREERVGVLFPPGIDGTVVNLAALSAGRAVLNLDPAAPPTTLEQQLGAASVRRVITSRACAACLEGCVVLEEVESTVSTAARFGCWIACRALPAGVLARTGWFGSRGDLDATAALIPADLHRGEGRRPIVVLSHHNILSNIESLRQVFRLTPEDRILGAIPYASAFGLTHTLLLPAVAGVGVVHHAEAIDGPTIGRLIAEHCVSILPASPAQLERFCETVEASRFGSLRHIVTAGDGLSPALCRRVERRFGLEPLAGFGCAECAPLISLNLPVAAEGRRERDLCTGNVGHPLPGIAVRIVDRRRGEALPPERPGRLQVKGSNVMRGYLDDPAATARVLRNGWLDTGREAVRDVDGFLTLLD